MNGIQFKERYPTLYQAGVDMLVDSGATPLLIEPSPGEVPQFPEEQYDELEAYLQANKDTPVRTYWPDVPAHFDIRPDMPVYDVAIAPDEDEWAQLEKHLPMEWREVFAAFGELFQGNLSEVYTYRTEL